MPAGGLDPEGVGTEIAIAGGPARRRARARARSATSTPTASATRVSDLAEARAFRRVFGAGGRSGHGAQGLHGQPVSGCGAVELIGSLLGVNRGLIPAVLNCDEPDPACGLDLVRGRPRPTDNPTFVKTNLTRHGQAAALVVRGNPGRTLSRPEDPAGRLATRATQPLETERTLACVVSS